MQIAASLALLALVLLAYRRAFGREGTWVLLVLRVGQMALLFLILTGQVLRLSWTERPSRVSVLLDRSASMAGWGAESVAAEIVARLSSQGRFSLESWEFAGTVRRQTTSSPDIDTSRTKLGAALATVANTRPGAIVLLSDGQDNSETDPVVMARDAGVPVYAVGFGGGGQTNIRLTRIEVPSTVNVGETVIVKVRLFSSGLAKTRVRVRLGDETVSVVKDTGATEQDAEFRLHFESAGVHVLEAVVESLPGELSYVDNRLVTILDVRSTRTRVGYLTNRPGLSTRFLLQTLRADGRVELFQWIATRMISEIADLNRAGVYILDACAENEDMRRALILIERRVRRGAGVLIVAGPGFEPGEIVSSMLGLEGSEDTDSGMFSPVVTSTGRLLPWFAMEKGIDFRSVPPFQKVWRGRFTPGKYEVWVESAENGAPLFLSTRYGRGKVVFVAGYPLWRWGYGPELRFDETSPLGVLVGNLIQFLGDIDTVRFKAETGRRRYLTGEPISVFLTAKAADGSGWEGLVPYVYTDSPDVPVPMTEVGQGRYEAVFQCGPGHKTARVVVMAGDTIVGRTTVQFEVIEQTLERSLTGMNAEVLRRIAAVSGGYFFMAESLAVERLDIRPATFQRAFALDMRRHIWGYLVFVLFAAVELILRRMRGWL